MNDEFIPNEDGSRIADEPLGLAKYRTTIIRLRGELMSLTDMWIANDRPRNQEPYEWLRIKATEQFLETLGITTGSTRSNLLVTVDENSFGTRGTWGHWQLALTYAHYLSPVFYIWCNEVLLHSLLALGGPNPGPKRLAALFEDHFERLHQSVRLELTQRTKRILALVAAEEPYGGLCPCCGQTPVVTEAGEPLPGAEFDHYFDRSLSKPEHCWVICRECHLELTASPALKEFKRSEFHTFRGRVLDYLMTERSRRRERGTLEETAT